MNKFKINRACSKFIIIIGILFSITFTHKLESRENFIVATVNGLLITKIDVIDRAKIIYYSINKNNNFKNLDKFYSQALEILINEKIIKSAGLKSNKNIENQLEDTAYKIALSQFQNSEEIFSKYSKKLSISRKSVIDKYQSELIWGIVLKNNFKQDIININEEVQEIINKNTLEKNKDKYDLAEIVISRRNNKQLLKKILTALKRGANFLQIAKQISTSTSKRFGGKIGWKNFDELPIEITSKVSQINKDDIFDFGTKDTYNIIKVLAKRTKGKVTPSEDKVILAEIKFKIDFGDKNKIYANLKNKLSLDLTSNNKCNSLKKVDYIKNINIKFLKSRIADLSIATQRDLNNLKLNDIMNPTYSGNNGYFYILCDKFKAKLKDFNPNIIKKSILAKRFKILSAKLLKKLNQKALITIKNELN